MEETVRILHVLNQMELGGAESRIMDLYRNIDTDKVQFDFAVHVANEAYFDNEIRERGGKIYVWSRLGFTTLFKYIKEVNRFFKAHREYNIVHGHSVGFGFIYHLIAKKNGVKIRIGHGRSSSVERHLRGYITLITIKLLRYCVTDYFACSIPAGQFAYGKRNMRKGKVRIINNAIDANEFSFSQVDRDKLREELGVANKFVVGHVGNFTYPKNHDFLLDVFKEILLIKKDAILLLVGQGELMEMVMKKTQGLGLYPNIIFAGQRNDIPALLSAMDVFVFPSHFEGLPGAVIEAQAAGLRCFVSGNISREVRITELVQLLSLKETAGVWARKILDDSEYERENMYKKIVAVGFDVKTVAKELQEFYIKRAVE